MIGPSDYKSWPNDENKVYKDLKIQDPTPGLSGNYTCKVSTFENEGLVEQQLNIFGMFSIPPTFFIPIFIAKINASILAKLIVTSTTICFLNSCRKNMSNIKSNCYFS